jgi:hypothetical protein
MPFNGVASDARCMTREVAPNTVFHFEFHELTRGHVLAMNREAGGLHAIRPS